MGAVKLQRLVKIIDQQPVTEALDYVRAISPTQAKAAKRLGLKQPHFSKLRAGRVGAIRIATLERLLQLLPAFHRKAVRAAFEPAGAALIRTAYSGWLEHYRRQLFLGLRRRHVRTEDGISLLSRQTLRKRAAEGEASLHTIWGVAEGDTSPDDDSPKEPNRKTSSGRGYWEPESSGALTKFWNRQLKAGHSEARVELAIYRILGGLDDAAHSAFVERHWREISKPERVRFVQAGIKRESILLNREPEARRIQDLALMTADQFRKRFGPENVVKSRKIAK